MKLSEAINRSDAVWRRTLRATLSSVIAETVGSRKHRINWANWYSGQGEGPTVTILPYDRYAQAAPKHKLRVVFQLQNRDEGYEVSARITDANCELREWGNILFFTWDELDRPWQCSGKLGEKLDVLLDDFIREIMSLF